MAIKRKEITIRFTLSSNPGEAPQTFGPGGSNTVELKGLRSSVRISKVGTPASAVMSMQVWGMRLELMNKLATLGMVYKQIRPNVVTVLAGEEGSPPSVAFIGTIVQAWTDFSHMPDVPFHVEAQTLGYSAVAPAEPSSFEGSVDVVETLKNFASKMELKFENSNNLTGIKVSRSYLWGSMRDQVGVLANAAGIAWCVDDGTLAIWPQGKYRKVAVPEISPENGLVGYPGFTAYGITLKTLYNPALVFQGNIKLKTSLAPANIDGEWTVFGLDHALDALVPHGEWFTTVTCYNPNFPRAVN